MIIILTFNLLLFLNKYNIPSPALTNKPASNAPNGILELTKSVVSKIDDAQFGIRPTNIANIGEI